MTLASGHAPFGPWNPGIESPVPRDLRHLATLFRPEHVFTSYAAAAERAGFTGLEMRDLVLFRPQRLALHALLVQLTARFSIPDGAKIEDLGINFREIARTLLARCIEPAMPGIERRFEELRRQLDGEAHTEADALMSALRDRETAPSRRRGPPPAAPSAADIAALLERRLAVGGERQQASLRALGKVVTAVLARHGRMWGGADLIAPIAADMACNEAAGKEIAAMIEPVLDEAAAALGYRLLPNQKQPVVMNTKGPSASGKSTLRPLQRTLARELGFTWAEFALISPDIWRKQLLDYSSLGPHYKYAGAFTGEEVRIVDEKLDAYMAAKAKRGEMPHMLIDRFRFDSFAPDSHEAGSNLLTRFGQIVYLFFIITPPAQLVERAWHRGLDVGRYKAVDDILAHSIEAYAGMPELLFTWIQRTDKRVHFEFLDNSVRLGERPRTVAFGWNDTLNVLDVGGMVNLERYRRVNVDAAGPASLYRDPALLAAERNVAFIRRSVERFREVRFADAASGRVYLTLASGRVAAVDADGLRRAAAHEDARAGLAAAAPAVFELDFPSADLGMLGAEDKRHTVGAWGC